MFKTKEEPIVIQKPLQYSKVNSCEFYVGISKLDVLNAIAFYVRQSLKDCKPGVYSSWIKRELQYGNINYMTDNEILNLIPMNIEHSQTQKGIKTETWVFGSKNSGNTFKFNENGILKSFTIKNLAQFYAKW